MATILLADDELSVRKGYAGLLVGAGYVVTAVRDGEEAVKSFLADRPDLVVLDYKMPKMDGFRACEQIRARDARVPILILTANDSEANEVRAFGLGADDFVSKSDSESVLLSRLARALARASSATRTAPSRKTLQLDDVRVDLSTLTVTENERETGTLTRTEADVLAILAGARGRMFSNDEIIAALRGTGYACEDTLVYVHISNIRRKLGSAARFLISRRGAGYALID